MTTVSDAKGVAAVAATDILDAVRAPYASQSDNVKIQIGQLRNFTYNTSLVSGQWTIVPSIFRLRLTGTGNVIVDSRNKLLVESLALYTYTLSGATNQIEFPFLGNDATEIRVTLTGTATAEVI